MGRDKPWLELRGQAIIVRLIEVLRPLFPRLRIIANDPARFGALGLSVQPDIRPGCGALGGIESALATASFEAVFVAACDLPFLDAGFVRTLVGLLPGHDAVVPWGKKGAEPLCAVYSARCRTTVTRALDRGELKVADFLSGLRVRRVEGDELARLDPDGLSRFNLNTPEDYQRARKLVGDR